MANQQLLDFIKQQVLLGKDKEIISKELLNNGWSLSDIEEGFKDVNIPNNKKQNERLFSSWVFFIPFIQIFGCGFLLLTSLGLCGWPGDGRGSNCSLGQTIGVINTFIFFGLPIFIFIFSLLKTPQNKARNLINFLISGIIPLLVLGFVLHNIYISNKEMEKSKKQLEERLSTSLNMENYSVTTEPATEITNHGAVLNANVKSLVNNGIYPLGDIGFYIGLSKTNMDYISSGRCEKSSVINGHCDSNLNVRQGEPILPLKSHTTYYFAAAIEFFPIERNGTSKIKKSDTILSFTTQ